MLWLFTNECYGLGQPSSGVSRSTIELSTCRWYHTNSRKWRGAKELLLNEGERVEWKRFQKTKIIELPGILLCSGCYQTGWLINNSNLSHSSGKWKSEIREPASLGVGLVLGHRFLYPHMVEGARVLCGSFFVKALIQFRRTPTIMT